MRNAFYGALLLIAFSVGFLVARHFHSPDVISARRVLYYVDPMHPVYKSEKPGAGIVSSRTEAVKFQCLLSAVVLVSGMVFGQASQDQTAKNSLPMSVSPNDAQNNLRRRPVCKSPAMVADEQDKGTVRIAVIISPKGDITAAKVISGPPLLYSAAMKCVEHSEYTPFSRDGQPVTVVTEVDLRFPANSDAPGSTDPLYERTRAAAQKALALGKLDESAELYQQDVKLAESRQPGMQLEIAEALSELGHVRMRQGRYEDAEKLLHESIAAYEVEGASDSPQVGRAAEELGSVYLGKKEYSKAASFFLRALTIFTKDRSDATESRTLVSVSVERALFGLAAAKFQSGDLPAASSYCDQCIKEASDAHLSSAEMKQMFTNCAGVKRAVGEATQADVLLDRARALQEPAERQ